MKTFFKILLAAGVFVSGSAVDCDDQFHHEGGQCTGCHPKCTKMCGKTDKNSKACGNACIPAGRECHKPHGKACDCDPEADCSPKCVPTVCSFLFVFSLLVVHNVQCLVTYYFLFLICF